VTSKPDFKVMVLLLVFMQLTRDLFAIAKFLLLFRTLWTWYGLQRSSGSLRDYSSRLNVRQIAEAAEAFPCSTRV